MKIKKDFELVNIAEDYMLVPLGDEMEKFSGSVILNEVSAFLVEKLKTDRTEEELLELLCDEFDVDRASAQADIRAAVQKMRDVGIIDG